MSNLRKRNCTPTKGLICKTFSRSRIYSLGTSKRNRYRLRPIPMGSNRALIRLSCLDSFQTMDWCNSCWYCFSHTQHIFCLTTNQRTTMTLENIDILDRKKLTRSYPVLISGYAGCGKSSAVEFLSAEDKSRTVIFNFDNKTLPEDEEAQYFRVKYLNNPDDKKPTDIFQVVEVIKATIAIPGVDRIIIDTFSGFYKELDSVCNQRYNGLTFLV